MNEIYSKAFSEVDAILDLMPINLLNKIPEKFRQIIKSEKSITYTPIIKEPIEEFQLSEEAIIILALIYRDFLCSNEEKEKLKLRDTQKIKETEEELRKKYSPDDIFKKKKEIQEEDNIQIEETSIAVIQEEKWYKKIFNIIKKFFRR